MERFAAHKRSRLAGNAEFEQHLAVERHFAHEMAGIVGQKHRIVRRHVNAMGARILPLAPGAQKIAGAVENHHWVLAAVEHIDIIVFVDPDGADLFE
jgi:hypothetical protein